MFGVFLLVKWLCDWICEVLGLFPMMQGYRRMPRNEVCGEWYVCYVVCYMSLIHLHLWRPVLADLWSRLMPCASINWQLVKRAEALLVPHAYAQLCHIRIAFWIADDSCECFIVIKVVCKLWSGDFIWSDLVYYLSYDLLYCPIFHPFCLNIALCW